MKLFTDIDSMWTDTLADLLSRGKKCESRSGSTVELIGWGAQLMYPNLNWLVNKRRKLSPMYASAELLWYLSRETSIARLVEYAPQYKNFANNGEAYGAYGHRVATNIEGRVDQLELAIKILQEKSESRQCVVSLWRPKDLVYARSGEKKDLPCTLTWQFIVRENNLHMHAHMRSNDVWLGMPYDIYVNTSIQQLMANELGLELGTYTHTVGSMHLYDKNAQAAYEASDLQPSDRTPIQFAYVDGNDTFETAAVACELEQRIRHKRISGKSGITGCPLYDALGDQMRDTVLCCAKKFGNDMTDMIENPNLRNSLC